MRFEIEADIPETHEPTGDYRRPRDGEYWLGVHGQVRSGVAGSCRIILREKWKWPAWLKADYIEFDGASWIGHTGLHMAYIWKALFDFTPPPGNHKPGDRIFNPNRREP
jgi:hypothetical protein